MRGNTLNSQLKVLGIVPARGGSKGVPRKNIKLLNGKPLIWWTIKQALSSSVITDVIVSTDDLEISSVAQQAGAEVPFLRPKELASDTALRNDVITHALTTLKEYDYVIYLQPTSPFRKSYDIDNAFNQMLAYGLSSCVSVKPQKPSPHWIFNLDNGVAKTVLPALLSTNRQTDDNYHVLNGAIYISITDPFYRELTSDPFTSSNPYLYLMSVIDSCDIDSHQDWQYCEFLLMSGLISIE
ncbi:acylneuraminate cytidylyltransferase family protein [bacterium]|nr:acylneuraminate cytidylyltransferase family protein [bacterium]